MSALPTPRQVRDSGFTLVEVTLAILILTVGLMSMALLAARMMAGGRQSKYMSLAAALASEKLEDLERWSAGDPQVCVSTGSSTVGSLTADVLQTTACPAPSTASGSVNYYDDVSISLANGTGNCPDPTTGCFAETVSSQSGGSTAYTTTYHSPTGVITPATSTTAPGNTTFHRRWIIESNPTVNGSTVSNVRRVTVLVTLMDASVQPPVTFQMSVVRP